MSSDVVRLYPAPSVELPLEGLYLAHDLQHLGTAMRPFVYSNFITSLDGRISQPDPTTGHRRVPPSIANAHDWRLYTELAAQADVVLTTARHLRAVAAGRHSNLLSLDSELIRWRRSRGLSERPVVAALSVALEIPARALREITAAPIVAITCDETSTEKAQALEAEGIEVVRAGAGPLLSGKAVVGTLAERGHRSIYSVAGPQVLHTLLQADVLDRLYLTIAQVLLGGEAFDTLTRGSILDPPRGFDLAELYLDRLAPTGLTQLLATFERATPALHAE
jgi:riboflavin biosynthesis pyrimidine reductase